MELKFGHIEAKSDKAVLFLKGVIGRDINGDKFADELLNASISYNNIDLYINTIGGNVVQGYSIITAIRLIQEAGKNLRLINSGVAYSMGGFILASGKKGTRYAYDYSMAMIHDPRPADKNAVLSKKDKEMIGKTVDSLAIVISENTGKDIEAVKSDMAKETFMNPSEMQEKGIIDEILQSGRTIKLDTADMAACMAACADITNEIVKPKINTNMSKLNGLLMLQAEASEEAGYIAVEALKEKASKAIELEASLEAKDSEIAKLQAKLEASDKEAKLVSAKSLIEQNAHKVGDNKEIVAMWIEDAIKDFEGTEKKLNAITVTERESTNAKLEAGANDSDLNASAKAYADLLEDPSKMDSIGEDALNKLEAAYKAVNPISLTVQK